MVASFIVAAEETEEFREWNRKMMESSIKMVKLLLVMLILWSFVTVGWVIHLILNASHPPLMASTRSYTNFKRSLEVDVKEIKYENLKFYTVITQDQDGKDGADYWNRIKLIIGGFHQLREDEGKVPEIHFILNFTGGLNKLQIEESKAWNKVYFKNGLQQIERSNASYNDYIWFSSDYAFNPVALDLRKAELMCDNKMYKDAFKKGRNVMETIYKEKMALIDIKSKSQVLRVNEKNDDNNNDNDNDNDNNNNKNNNHNNNHNKNNNHNNNHNHNKNNNNNTLSSSHWGMLPISKVTKSLKCHVDLKYESIEYGGSLTSVEDFDLLEDLERNFRGPKLAIGVPTTSKGMKLPGEDSILLRALIPSIGKTLSGDEMEKFRIVIFVGFDDGDEYFEDDEMRNNLKTNMTKLLDSSSISVVFVRLAPLGRVAMTWNMIFSVARRSCQFEYFYQVNDDLVIKTRGWLSKFSETLKSVEGIGVVGPSDSFNGFSCSLLTQAFVTYKHFEIFGGKFYPIAFSDWKSDRWLSFVYGANRTFCWPEIEATNGAKGTRYEACGFGEWKIYLEKGIEEVEKQMKLIV